jgi:hypothetical protein
VAATGAVRKLCARPLPKGSISAVPNQIEYAVNSSALFRGAQ